MGRSDFSVAADVADADEPERVEIELFLVASARALNTMKVVFASDFKHDSAFLPLELEVHELEIFVPVVDVLRHEGVGLEVKVCLEHSLKECSIPGVVVSSDKWRTPVVCVFVMVSVVSFEQGAVLLFLALVTRFRLLCGFVDQGEHISRAALAEFHAKGVLAPKVLVHGFVNEGWNEGFPFRVYGGSSEVIILEPVPCIDFGLQAPIRQPFVEDTYIRFVKILCFKLPASLAFEAFNDANHALELLVCGGGCSHHG